MNRIVTLDYLRGICALLILFYHYFTWSFYELGSDNFLGKMGIYGVGIFYMLSGLTLYVVYKNIPFDNLVNIKNFLYKRFLRIYPLMWFVTILSFLISIRNSEISFSKLVLNLTGLFGFVQWDQYYATGLWSIGNELVFYTFIPVFFILLKYNKIYIYILGLFILLVSVYFSFNVLSSNLILTDQWRNYVNPLNQLILFYIGFIIPIIFDSIKIKNMILFLALFIVLLLFTFYPTSGDLINIVTGVNRYFYILITGIICLITYKAVNVKIPFTLHKTLLYLGEISYSVYLIHPLVYGVNKYINEKFFHFDMKIVLIFSILITLIASHFSYKYIENIFKKTSAKVKLIKA